MDVNCWAIYLFDVYFQMVSCDSYVKLMQTSFELKSMQMQSKMALINKLLRLVLVQIY